MGETNVLFFEHIQWYSHRGYLRALAAAVGASCERYPQIQIDYSAQIVRNAQVTSRKFMTFRMGLWLFVCGLLTPVGALVFALCLHEFDQRQDAGLTAERD